MGMFDGLFDSNSNNDKDKNGVQAGGFNLPSQQGVTPESGSMFADLFSNNKSTTNNSSLTNTFASKFPTSPQGYPKPAPQPQQTNNLLSTVKNALVQIEQFISGDQNGKPTQQQMNTPNTQAPGSATMQFVPPAQTQTAASFTNPGKNASPNTMVNGQNVGGSTISQAPQKNFFQNVFDTITSPFKTSSEDQKTKDYVTMQTYNALKEKNPNVSFTAVQNNVDELGRSLMNNLGVNTYPSNKQFTQMMITAPVVLSLVGAPALAAGAAAESASAAGLGDAAISEAAATAERASAVKTAMTTGLGLGGFQALAEGENAIVSKIQNQKYVPFSGKGVGDLLPADTNETTRTVVDLLDMFAKGAALHSVYTKAPDLAQLFTKDITTNYSLPHDVFIPADKMRSIFGSGDQITPDELDIVKKAGLNGTQYRDAIKYGLNVQMPVEQAITLADKPYWAKLKSILQIKPFEPQVAKNSIGEVTSNNTSGLLASGEQAPVEPLKNITPNVDTFNKNIAEYRTSGGYSVGTPTENASLRDVAALADKPDVIAHTQAKVQEAVSNGTLPVDKNGDITLYRGGNPSTVNKLSSATYDKAVAEHFAENAGGVLHEFKVKPEDIKAFVGRSEGEVLVSPDKVAGQGEISETKNTNNSVQPEISASDNAGQGEKVTTQYDSKGQVVKPQKVINNKEVQYVRDVVQSKMEVLRQSAKSGEDFNKGIDSLVKDISERANGDKVVLSALRTELNKEMYGMVGGTGDYKQDYKALQGMLSDHESDTGKVLNNLDSHIAQLDEKLLAAKPPERSAAPQVSAKIGTEQKGFVGSQEPVGTGKAETPQALERLMEHLKEADPKKYEEIKNNEVKYNTVNLKKDAEAAVKLVEEDPNRAYRIAKGVEAPPVGQLQENIALALADRLREEGSNSKWIDIELSHDLRQTRRGQEIVADRGRFNDNSAHHYVSVLLDRRMSAAGKNIKDQLTDVVGKKPSAKQQVVAKIDRQTKRLAQEMTAEQSKIKLAQDIIDQLMCK